MKDIKLPPLPHWCEAGSPFADQMQSYAREAVEADRAQRVPHPVYLSARALIDAARRDWPSSSVHRARVLDEANALETALLASTPAPAPLLARIAELEAANEAFGKRQEWWNTRMWELEQQLEEARKQMERQKDEWLSWEAKRRDLEADAIRARGTK